MKLNLQTHLNQSGQATVEAILIITLLLGVSLSISNFYTSNNAFAKVIEGPWDFVDGMVRDGVWTKSNASHINNPNARRRHASRQGTRQTPNQSFDDNESHLVN